MAVLASLVAVVSLCWGSALVADQGAQASAYARESRTRYGETSPSTHTVVMEGTSFQPADLKISVGDTVVWVNKDPFPHTATSKNGEFDSKEIAEGKSWENTFKTKGDFAYVCTLHPPMTGTLKVE